MSNNDFMRAINQIDRRIDEPLKRFGEDSRLADIKRRWRDLNTNCKGQIDVSKVNGRHVQAINSEGARLLSSSNVDEFLRKLKVLEDIIRDLY